MKQMLTLTAAAMLALSSLAVHAADEKKEPSPAQKAQQQRMSDCNKEAKTDGKEGDARKDFMKACLAGKTPAASAPAQQTKMKTCNTEAGDKKGDERKAFMKECLKAH